MNFRRTLIHLKFLGFVILLYVFVIQKADGKTHHHKFVVRSSAHTRLCSTKNILTVNGKFPGPTLYVNRGDIAIIKVYNKAKYNITLHWHGVKQPRNPWSDGPEYITQCPIRPWKYFTYRVRFTTEEGTLWWHAHSGWARSTVHGAIIVYPKPGSHYPFPKPHAEVPMILGDWWKEDTIEIEESSVTGGIPKLSDAYTINGQPGYLYQCSKQGTFKMMVKQGRTYLLRLINSVMDEEIFFAIAHHKIILVGIDGSYTKPLKTNYLMITPGQTMDVLLEANQPPNTYFMAARSYSRAFDAGFGNITATAILQYENGHHPPMISLSLPPFPSNNQTEASTIFTKGLRSLASKEHPAKVPKKIDTHLFYTISVHEVDCTHNKPCKGSLRKRFSASINNISFVAPSIDVLQAHYNKITDISSKDIPSKPPKKFDHNEDHFAENSFTTDTGTKVEVLEYNANVEIVVQGTNLLEGDNHPIHLHGYTFFVVGGGYGKFDPEKDPLSYNLVDPPEETTFALPNNGWVAIRFKANNPGVWFMHCHLERHADWGMGTVFLVKNGQDPQARILPPPSDLPSC